MTKPTQRRVRGLAARFWPRVDRRELDECWPWIGSVRPGGYGTLGRGRRGEGQIGAHVAAYEVTYGPVPPGREIDHLCHDPNTCVGGFACLHRRCCNPRHLEAVPRAQNLSRERRINRQAEKTHCVHGHPLSGDNLYIIPASGGRTCHTCRKAGHARYSEERRAERAMAVDGYGQAIDAGTTALIPHE